MKPFKAYNQMTVEIHDRGITIKSTTKPQMEMTAEINKAGKVKLANMLRDQASCS